MLSPLFHADGTTMASVYMPERVLNPDGESVMIEDMIVDVTLKGEITYIELFNPPTDLPEYYPLPFYYDHTHDTYDLFFMKAGPRTYSVRHTDHDYIDLIFDHDASLVIGLRICDAHTRLPRMNLRP
jgi:hypothetical protein